MTNVQPTGNELYFAKRLMALKQLEQRIDVIDEMEVDFSTMRAILQDLFRLSGTYGYLKDFTWSFMKCDMGIFSPFHEYQKAYEWMMNLVSKTFSDDLAQAEMNFLRRSDLSQEEINRLLDAAGDVLEDYIEYLTEIFSWGGVKDRYLVEEKNGNWSVTYVPDDEGDDEWESVPVYQIEV